MLNGIDSMINRPILKILWIQDNLHSSVNDFLNAVEVSKINGYYLIIYD